MTDFCGWITAGEADVEQYFWECADCGIDSVCEVCAIRCHSGHNITRDAGTKWGLFGTSVVRLSLAL